MSLQQLVIALTEMIVTGLPKANGVQDRRLYCQQAIDLLRNLTYDIPDSEQTRIDAILDSFQKDLDNAK